MLWGTMRDAADPVRDLRPCFDSTRECSRRSALKAGLTTALALPAFAAGDIQDEDAVLLDEERQIIDNFAASGCLEHAEDRRLVSI
jgi:hypothetical protein